MVKVASGLDPLWSEHFSSQERGGAQVGTEAALDPKFPLEVSATHWRSALRSPSLPGSGPFPFQMEKLVQAELSVDTLFSHTGEGYLGFTF
jgi:hypothetical protein